LENGNNVKIIFDSQENIINQTDALITKKKNIFLSISVADCIPVFFYESQAKIIGLAHAGWRGIAGGVIENTMKKITELGGMAENLKIALGPGINKCHFEVGEEVVDKFKNYKEYIFKKDKKYFIDLRGIIKKKLNKLGVKSENIEDCNICTFCSKNLFSFRSDGGGDWDEGIIIYLSLRACLSAFGGTRQPAGRQAGFLIAFGFGNDKNNLTYN